MTSSIATEQEAMSVVTARDRALVISQHVLRQLANRPVPKDLLAYEPLPTDLIITTHPKAGTTLIQQMTYQLLVKSGTIPLNEDYTEINQVAPWIDWHVQMDTPILKLPQPRIFKSHSPKHVFEQAGKTKQKHIIVIRDPIDYPSSFLDFLYRPLTYDYNKQEELYQPDIMNQVLYLFSRSRLLDLPLDSSDVAGNHANPCDFLKHSWFPFHRSWVTPTISPNILILFYEDINRDMCGTVERIANFANVEVTDDQINQVVELCSRDLMANDKRFETKAEAKAFKSRGGAKKVMVQRCSGFKGVKMSDEIIRLVNERFKTMFSVDNYEQFKKMVNEKQKHLHDR